MVVLELKWIMKYEWQKNPKISTVCNRYEFSLNLHSLTHHKSLHLNWYFCDWKILQFPHCVSGWLQMGQTPAWKWCSREGLDEIIFILSLALTDKVTKKLSWCYCSWEMPSLHFSVSSSSSQFWNVVFFAQEVFLGTFRRLTIIFEVN